MRPISLTLLLAIVFFCATVAVAETTVIVGATVHTVGPQGSIDNATIVIRNGRITAIGANFKPPDGADVIDASGKVITPGLFSPIGNLGLVEVGYSAGPLDYVQRGDQFTASFDIADAFNPRSTLIAVNRIEGVTRALIVPEPAPPDEAGLVSNVISGLAAIANLSGDDNSIDRRAAALVVNLGENGVGLAGTSRASAHLVLQNALDEALDYREHGDAFERGQHRDYSLSLNDLQALQRVINGDIPLIANVDRASDIAALIRLVDAYDIRVIINGGAEAWMHADRLAAHGIPVIVAPAENLPDNFDRLNSRSESAAILADAGVPVLFADGDNTHNARNITQSAGNATVVGLSWQNALRAITLTPAEIYGVSDRVGSIEVGKQADLVIWPADPLELTSYPEQVFINGKSISMQSRQTLLRDRYIDLSSETPPAYRK